MGSPTHLGPGALRPLPGIEWSGPLDLLVGATALLIGILNDHNDYQSVLKAKAGLNIPRYKPIWGQGEMHNTGKRIQFGQRY